MHGDTCEIHVVGLYCILEMSRGENCSSRFKRRRTIACDVQSMVGEFIVLAIIADVVGGRWHKELHGPVGYFTPDVFENRG